MRVLMIPDSLIIEEQRRRERESQWEPIPLHAPTPMPRVPRDEDREPRDEETGRGVIIIDISDYSETRL